MASALAIILPLISLFAFPAPFTAALAFLGSFIFPPLAFSVGVLADLLYAPPGLPYASIIGLAASICAFFMRGFWKARIMS